MPKLKPSKRIQVHDALVEFCDDIDQTGGIRPVKGTYVPAADDQWVDLAETYLKACKALGRKPKYDEECKRCGSDLDEKGYCKDETCPHSDHLQNETWTEG